MGNIGGKEKNTDYVNDRISRLYGSLLPSAIGSLLTATVASLIDVVILSYYLGPDMLAVVGLCMPVYMMVNTLGMLIASGASTLYAQYLGEGNREEGCRFFTAAVMQMCICGGLLMMAGLSFTEHVVSLLGANASVVEETGEYVHVLFFFMIPLMFYVLLLFFVRIDNDPKRTLSATIVCAVVNLILDVLFVGPLALGVTGAAMATCLAYTLGLVVNMTHFITSKNSLRLVFNGLSGRNVRIWKAGMPLAVSQLGMTVSTNIYNNLIIRAGNEAYVAVYTVLTQLSMISMAIYDGIGQAAQPLIAAANGAGKPDRIKKVFKYGVRLELIGTVGLAVMYVLGAGAVAILFSIREGEMLALTVSGIRIYALSVPFMGLNSIIMYYFQAQEKAGRGLLISLLCGSVLPVLALVIIITAFGNDYVWFSFVTAQAAALGVSFLLYCN